MVARFDHIAITVLKGINLFGDHGLDGDAKVREHRQILSKFFDNRGNGRKQIVGFLVLSGFDERFKSGETVIEKTEDFFKGSGNK